MHPAVRLGASRGASLPSMAPVVDHLGVVAAAAAQPRLAAGSRGPGGRRSIRFPSLSPTSGRATRTVTGSRCRRR
jgi:hypothetical protein